MIRNRSSDSASHRSRKGGALEGGLRPVTAAVRLWGVGWIAEVGLALAVAAMPANAQTGMTEDRKYQRAFDEAVQKGLAFLASQQKADGSFDPIPAVTSLAILAFLASGYGPGLHPYGEVINRAIDSVLNIASPEGVLIGGQGRFYSHSISTLMLAEVSGMVDPKRQARIDAVLPKAVRVLLAAQDVPKPPRQQGGWRYEPNSNDSDLSHSGWALLALRAARNNGAPVPEEAVEKAVRFILHCRREDGGFSYQPAGGSNMTRAGIGLLCLELSGRHRDNVTLKAAEYIARKFPNMDGELTHYYALYYVANGMYQLGGEEWETFAPRLYDYILGQQQPAGFWAGHHHDANRVYATSMAILALSVSYHQLPIYQR